MKTKTLQLFLLQFLLLPFLVFAQNIRINEVSSSNSNILMDIDGDYPDWIELYNYSDSVVSLKDYFLTDNEDKLEKWAFPDIQMKPDSLLLIFASGKDRIETIQHWETVVREGDECRYLLPYSNPTNEWRLASYNDANWTKDELGLGYGDNDDNTIVPKTISVYLRCKFTIDDVNQVAGLYLDVDYDDGFVAYINGVEVARENLGLVGSYVNYNAYTDSDHEAQMYQGKLPNSYPLSDKTNILQNGENVLAIQVHNATNTSSDLSIIPFLSLGYYNTPANSRGIVDFLKLPTTKLHTNFKLSSSGEPLIISKKSHEIIDSLNTRKQLADISLGRFPDGSNNIFYFDKPTPGNKNINDGFNGFLKPPSFSVERGFYTQPFFLDLSNPNQIGSIKYTLDGSEPTEESKTYISQLVVSKTSVLRAKIIADSSFLPSNTITKTFFINQEQRLPVISLSTNPEYFFDFNTGIYVEGPNAQSDLPHFGANYWQDWEKPIHVELFEEDNQFGFEMDLGVKIFGQWSRANAQKSLAFYARSQYGYPEIDYQLFPNSDIKKYQNFLLRNSGTDWWYSMIRDPLHHSIVADLDIDKQNYRPVVVYLNGAYWGIHNLREKINEHYVETHHGVPSDDINMVKNNFEIVNGSKDSYMDFYNSLNNMDMKTDEAFDYIDSKIDVKNFIDYNLLEIYIDNNDWPGNNIKFWQQRSTDSKWRWILYDTDFGFGIWNPYAYNKNTLEFALAVNGPDWPNPPWATFLLRKFIQNPKFRNLFIARYSTYSNTIFTSQNVDNLITVLSSKINSEMSDHVIRWGNRYSTWVNEISAMRNFAYYRLTYLNLYFKSYFNISGQFNLTINHNSEKGNIYLTDYKIENNNWTGKLFNNIPIEIRAESNPDFVFSHWSGDITTNENPLVLNTSENISITPVFAAVTDTLIVINEINYNSSDLFNPEDWVELYNYSNKPIDLSGWIFKDENALQVFQIPQGSMIEEGDFLILCRDTLLFKSKFPEVKKYIGNLGFGLSGGGEKLSLLTHSGFLVDSLTYDDIEPWPSIADGGGPTLELKNPFVDNSKYYYWQASAEYGTPGETNSNYTDVASNINNVPSEFKLYPNYPNPFNPTTQISYEIPINSRVRLEIFNTLGQSVKVLVNDFKAAGIYKTNWNAENLPSGIYLISIRAEGLNSSKYFRQVKKALLLK